MTAEVITTAKGTGQRFDRRIVETNRIVDVQLDHEGSKNRERKIRIVLEPDEKDQEIIGFGGAFTDSSAGALLQMSETLRIEIVRRYFDPVHGLGYNIGRVPIGACDFSRTYYSCDDHKNDTKLSFFSIEEDKKGIIPLIRSARSYLQDPDDLYLYALPWSPPAWMKSNHDMCNGGKLKKRYYQTMASYIGHFVDAYRDCGISIRAVTSQNEPDQVQKWPSCTFSAGEEADFLTFLIPEMKRRGVRILCWDSNKDFVRERTEYLMKKSLVSEGIDGVSFHWYSGGMYAELEKIHKEYPKLTLCATEGCVVMPEHLDDWSVGEQYALDMIEDLNHGTSLWMDWNMFLDEKSGPKMFVNPCAAPIILDSSHQQLKYMTSYYYIGHLSRYIKRGAIKIGARITDMHPEEGAEKTIRCCAFLNPDGNLCLIILNTGNNPADVIMEAYGTQTSLTIVEHSISTVLLKS